jgi:hypothetical protein
MSRKIQGPLWNPVFDEMASGTTKWGNLIRTRKSKTKSKSRSKSRSLSNFALRNYKTPTLALRADIYKTFPVVVTEPVRGVYAIKWHRDNLREWRETHPTSWDEYQDYKDWVEVRLLHSLKKHSHLYNVLPPVSRDEIVRFRMVGEEPTHINRRNSRNSRNSRNGPVLMSLKNIKDAFPAIYKLNALGDYEIEMRGDFMRSVSETESTRVWNLLLSALSKSPAWSVVKEGGPRPFVVAVIRLN